MAVSLPGDGQHRQTTRRLQLEDGEVDRRLDTLESQGTGTTSTQTPITTPGQVPTERPPIIQMLRNTDMNHSVDTWHNTTPSGTEQEEECANVYAHLEDVAVSSTGGITATDNTLVLTESLFEAGDAGERIVVEGADTGGEDLATTIASFTNATTVELTDPAVTTVVGAVVRWRLQKLGKKNRRVSADQVNDVLKTDDHADFADVGQIQDPKWDKTRGISMLGSKNTLFFPFGHYDGTPNSVNNTFIPLHPLYPGRKVFMRINAARASRYVKLRDRMFFGIWNNKDTGLEFARGSDLELSVSTTDPVHSTTAIYQLVIETDQGFNVVSRQKTFTTSPDNGEFSLSVFNIIRWTAYAGTLRAKLYRKLGSGNVFLITTIGTGIGSYVDRNPSTRIDTGTTSFPTITNRVRGVRSYFATGTGQLDLIPYDGETALDANGAPITLPWRPIELDVPFPSTVDLGDVEDPGMRIGLTEAPSLYLDDVVTDGTTTIASAAAQFESYHNGLSVILTDPATGDVLETTIDSKGGDDEVTLADVVPWTSTGNTLEILEGAPHGLLLDLAGASFLPGEWAHHSEDINRPQTVASNPNGSTQGGPTGGPPDGGGTGGPICVIETSLISVIFDGEIIPIPARACAIGDKVFYGEYYSNGTPKSNTIKGVRFSDSDEIIELRTDDAELGPTKSHRFVTDDRNFQHGTSTAYIKKGDFLLKFEENEYIIKPVLERIVRKGKFRVVSFELDGPDQEKKHLFLVNGYVSHNEKPIDGNPQF